ncbi:MAG: MmgE/PrpD family protein [Actinobacteria bacterium]|nr:MmgE/PrpD family protein [Actinomycetota bacterium]
MAETLVERLAAFAVETRDRGIPDVVVEDVKSKILDVLGNSLAAWGDEPGDAVHEMVSDWGGKPEAGVLGKTTRLPAPSAALVNGTLAHALDFDDTHLPSVLHPSASVVPAVLAAAQASGAGGLEALVAVAVGDEINVRLGAASYDPAIKNSVFFENGLHATSICGTLASAAATGMLLGLDETAMASAIGIAASMGAGLLEANRTGGSVKRMHCGWAAHAGISAGQLALRGVTGPPTVLEGRFGFFRAYSEGRFNEEALIGDLGGRWELQRVHYKPYPTNHFTHAGIDAALALRSRGLCVADIVEIELGVAAPTLRTIAEPPEQKVHPSSPYAAKFSGPFTVATALLGGGGLGVYLDDFTDATIEDPDRLRLAELVRCVADEEATDAFPNSFGGILKVRMSSGAVLEHRVRHNRGGPESPLSREELTTKFRLNASRRLSESDVVAMVEAVRRLEEAPSVDRVLEIA